MAATPSTRTIRSSEIMDNKAATLLMIGVVAIWVLHKPVSKAIHMLWHALFDHW